MFFCANSTSSAPRWFCKSVQRRRRSRKLSSRPVISFPSKSRCAINSAVCALTCSRGEHPDGDRCVADAKPEKKEKPKATVRQRDEDEDRPSRRAKPKREEPRREAARPKPERKAERQKPAQQPARSQASRSGGGGGMVGVGF